MRVINIVVLLFVFVVAACASIRNKMTFYPNTESEIPNEKIPSYAIELSIETSDHKIIQAFHFRHEDTTANHSLVVYFHGSSGNLYDRFGYAEKLYDMNQDVLLVSYRGYAKSSGKPTEKGIYNDGISAVNFAIDSLEYSSSDITIIGRSLGSTVAINTSQNKYLHGVVLIAPLTSGKEMLRSAGMSFLAFVAGGSYNSIGKINNLKSPILILHGTDDEVVPYAMGESLFNTYVGNKKIIPIQNAKHNNLEEVDSSLFWGEIEKFITK